MRQQNRLFSIHSNDLALPRWIIAPDLDTAMKYAGYWHHDSRSQNSYGVAAVKHLDSDTSIYYQMEHYGGTDTLHELVDSLAYQTSPDDEVRIKTFHNRSIISAPLYAWLGLTPRIIGELNASA